jgi:hypothetical protein
MIPKRASDWMFKKLESRAESWLSSVRDIASPLYHEYVEGMLADYWQIRRKWRDEKKYSEFRIILYSIAWGGQILWAVCRLNVHRVRRGLSYLFFAAEQYLALTHTSAPLSFRQSLTRRVFAWLHQLTGSVGMQTHMIEVMLSPTAQIVGWSEEATLVFGYQVDEVLGEVATDCFIPEIETSGRSLIDLIRNICLRPDQYSLNLNENQNQEGGRYWLLWANVPVHNQAGELVEIRCRGIKVEDPRFIQRLLLRWQTCRLLR